MSEVVTQMRAKINEFEIEIDSGETILQAARRTGVAIPTLCHDPRVGSSGSCRLCMVKVNGRRMPVPACKQILEPDMVITTEDDELREWRQTLLKLALSENPRETCTRCSEIGPCELHALADAMGVREAAYAGATSGALFEDANPFIVRDYSQCILCYRCTKVCGELEQVHAIVPTGRGFSTRISTADGGSLLDSTCTFCGQCIQACPTGALFDKKRLGKAKAEDVKTVRTICPYCGTGCGIELHVADGKVVGVTPDWKTPANEGALCVKGQFGMDFIHSGDRLTTPLIRKNGKFVPASWDEAYDLIAERFGKIKKEAGPDAFAVWSSARSTNEANFLVQKMARAALGTNNVDNCART